MSTRNYAWTALAETRQEAERLLIAAFDSHIKPLRGAADPNLMRRAVLDGEVTFIDIVPGTALRDTTVMIQP